MEIKRHENGKGSVVKYEWFGQIRCLFVADAKFRSRQRWGLRDERTDGISIKIEKFANVINPACSFDNKASKLCYELNESQLADRFVRASERSAKDNTDLLMLFNGTEAAHWCRSQNIEGVGFLDLPTIHEVMLIYAVADDLDILDPTISEHSRFALGIRNPDGRFGFYKRNAVWTSVEKNRKEACSILSNGLIFSQSKSELLGVIPVCEIKAF